MRRPPPGSLSMLCTPSLPPAAGEYRALVVSDVAARGLDIPE